MTLVIMYFLFRRGGENAMWLFRKDGADPPSFRRWQERQKRRGKRASATGRAEGRKFWAHVWQDAHASAHESRQRKHGRRIEDRRKRWQAEDIERQQEQVIAPCVFCGAGHGEECRAGCPEWEAFAADRATGGTRTVPPVPGSTEPLAAPEPSHAADTVPEETTGEWPAVPPAPSQARGTVPPGHATDTVPPNSAGADRANETTDRATPNPAQISGPPAEGPPSIQGGQTESAEHADTTPDDLARKRAEKTSTEPATTGGNVTTPAHYTGGAPAVPSGEFAGFEATVSGWNQIESLGAQLDAAYEAQMAALRANKADSQTIGMVAQAREANEYHMMTAGEARGDWQSRQGAVKEAKDATGARGDEALHVN